MLNVRAATVEVRRSGDTDRADGVGDDINLRIEALVLVGAGIEGGVLGGALAQTELFEQGEGGQWPAVGAGLGGRSECEVEALGAQRIMLAHVSYRPAPAKLVHPKVKLSPQA